MSSPTIGKIFVTRNGPMNFGSKAFEWPGRYNWLFLLNRLWCTWKPSTWSICHIVLCILFVQPFCGIIFAAGSSRRVRLLTVWNWTTVLDPCLPVAGFLILRRLLSMQDDQSGPRKEWPRYSSDTTCCMRSRPWAGICPSLHQLRWWISLERASLLCSPVLCCHFLPGEMEMSEFCAPQAAWPSAGRGRLRSFWLGLTRSSLPFHVCKLLRSLERLLKLGRRTILSLRPIQTCHMRLFR